MNAYIFYRLRNGLIIFCSIMIVILIFLFSNTQAAFPSFPIDLNKTDSTVIEYLRLSVAKNDIEAWLAAEKASWEPWLNKQKGFIKRDLFWDPDNEEALLLISWSNRSDWKTIPQAEIDKVQNDFEDLAMDLTHKYSLNPFPIKSQGEFLPQ